MKVEMINLIKSKMNEVLLPNQLEEFSKRTSLRTFSNSSS